MLYVIKSFSEKMTGLSEKTFFLDFPMATIQI